MKRIASLFAWALLLGVILGNAGWWPWNSWQFWVYAGLMSLAVKLRDNYIAVTVNREITRELERSLPIQGGFQ